MTKYQRLEKTKAAGILLDCGCLRLSPEKPFTYASGLQGPIYCDNRLILSYPEARQVLVEALAAVCQLQGLESLTMAGVASAGVPHAAFLAQKFGTSMVYVRSKKKEHGRQNLVEGRLEAGQEVVVVEDLINQGGSVASAVEALRGEGAIVNHVLCLVSYQLDTALEKMNELNLNMHYLCDFNAILDEALNRKQISALELESLKRWHDDPKNWRP